MAYFSDHLTRALAILTEGYGETGYTVDLDHFALPSGDLDTSEPDAIERRVEAEVAGSAPLGGYQNPIAGRDIRVSDLVVRVGYRHHPEGGADASVDARSLGGATTRAVQARASQDAALILAAVGWQPNWASLDPVVIDCAPDPAGWATSPPVEGRVFLTVPFVLTTRAAFPGAYGPSAT